jgi:hypothetical protein
MNIINRFVSKNLGSVIFNYLTVNKETVKTVNKKTVKYINHIYKYLNNFHRPYNYTPSHLKDKNYVERMFIYTENILIHFSEF